MALTRFTPSYQPTTITQYGPVPSQMFDMGTVDLASSITEGQKIAANQANLEAAARKEAEQKEVAEILGSLVNDPNVDAQTLYRSVAPAMIKHGPYCINVPLS